MSGPNVASITALAIHASGPDLGGSFRTDDERAGRWACRRLADAAEAVGHVCSVEIEHVHVGGWPSWWKQAIEHNHETWYVRVLVSAADVREGGYVHRQRRRDVAKAINREYHRVHQEWTVALNERNRVSREARGLERANANVASWTEAMPESGYMVPAGTGDEP